MSWKLDKTKEEWKAFKHELKTGSKRGGLHDYTDFFVEKCRHMPYTWGHVEAIGYPLWVILTVYLVYLALR